MYSSSPARTPVNVFMYFVIGVSSPHRARRVTYALAIYCGSLGVICGIDGGNGMYVDSMARRVAAEVQYSRTVHSMARRVAAEEVLDCT
jgi:hypothetical protein